LTIYCICILVQDYILRLESLTRNIFLVFQSEDTDNAICDSDRLSVKAGIVDLMLKSPSQIQRQLSASIAIIGEQDFPMQWEGLLQKMVAHFETGDFHIINGVLQTASSMFEKYSYEMKSQKLWTEIKYVLDNFAAPFTKLTSATMELAEQHKADPNALRVIFGSLVHIAKIFNYLNYQELPEFFEDNLQTWMVIFHGLLTSDNQLINNGDDDEPGIMEELKSQICDNIGERACAGLS
jgi:exportin-2 (importin alpha re-exporter)